VLYPLSYRGRLKGRQDTGFATRSPASGGLPGTKLAGAGSNRAMTGRGPQGARHRRRRAQGYEMALASGGRRHRACERRDFRRVREPHEYRREVQKALELNAVALAVTSLDDVLSPTGLLARLCARGYTIEAP
jgi:hypothetical protein